jgi:hypothetical protein
MCRLDLLERMKHGGGIKGLDDKSNGMEILMTESFTKIKPTDPLILGNESDRIPMSLSKADASR